MHHSLSASLAAALLMTGAALPALALVRDLVVVRRALGRYRRWLADRPADGAALTAAAVASGE